MKQEIKQIWAQALRSGRYKQARNVMRSESGRYCCLGVLTNLYLREHGCRPKTEKPLHDAVYGLENKSDEEMPGSKVLKWAGLHHTTCDTLASKNDGGESFSQIADYIEKKL